MAGRKTLRSIRLAREATNGTRVTPRYLWRGNGDWVVDEREVTKVEELVGISGGTDRTYIAKLAASVEIAETEATYKQLPALFYAMGMTPRTGFGNFGTRTPSVYTSTGSIWRYGLNVPSTVFPTTHSYTVESGDNVESQVAVYAVTEEVQLTFEAGEAAKVSANMLAQYGTRTNAEGSFSEVGTLENVTVMLSSKTRAFDITSVDWAAQTIPVTNDLRGIWGTNASNVWTVGSGGVILFHNGSTWAAQTSGTTNVLNSVWGANASNVWTVGAGGVILFYNGSTWAAQTSGTTNVLNSVWGADANNVWAVGAGGTIRYWNGSTWSSQTSGTANTLRAVWGVNANNVWAIGESGTILYWNGSTWAAQSSGTTNTLFGIWGTATNAIRVVGGSGTILFWNGSTWVAQTGVTTQNLLGIWGTTINTVWAVGTNGTIFYWNGSVWTEQTSNVIQDLLSVFAASATSVWASGESGTVVYFDGTKWTPIGSFSNNAVSGNLLKTELTIKAMWAPKYWLDGGILYPGTMVLTGHEITGKLTFEHQNGGSISAAGSAGQIEKWRNQQAQVLHMLWVDTDSFGSEVAFGVQLPFKWDTLQEYDDQNGNNIVSGEFTSKYNETVGNRGFLIFHTGYDYSNIVGTV